MAIKSNADLAERFQRLLDAGKSLPDALHHLVHEAVVEDRSDFLYQRDHFYTRTVIRTHADYLLTSMLQDPDLKVMRDPSNPTSPSHLAWMLDIVQGSAFKWPLDKLGRWIGYVQGVLVEQRKLNVETERNRTRSAYQIAYAADGLKVPETL